VTGLQGQRFRWGGAVQLRRPPSDRFGIGPHAPDNRMGAERGTVTIEAILIIPVLMFLLLLVVQFVLWAHAAQVVQLAASEGDRAARVVGGNPGEGATEARSVLAQSGSDVRSPVVTVTVLPADLAEITVSGQSVTILPGLSLPVTATVVGPVQEFRTSG